MDKAFYLLFRRWVFHLLSNYQSWKLLFDIGSSAAQRKCASCLATDPLNPDP